MAVDSFRCIEMAIFNTATLTGSYQMMNGPSQYVIYTGTGFQYSIKILEFYNAGTSPILISYDGVTNHDVMPAGGTKIIDLQTNHDNDGMTSSGHLIGRAGQIVWGLLPAGASPSTGNLYIVGYR